MGIYPGFSTEAMTEIWSDESRVAAMVDFEAAVAVAQAEVGDIPRDAATAITLATSDPVPETVLAEGWHAGTPVVPLLDVLKSRLDAESAAHLHHALTTQDVVDTATMVMARDAMTALRDLGETCWTSLRSATERFGSVATQARSFLQPAEETTFSARFARWSAPLDTLGRVLVRFPVQLGGLSGERRGISDRVVELVAQAVDLDPTPTVWHTDRTPVLEVVTIALRYAQWAEKVAGDIAILSAVGEVKTRGGGSSAAAGKQNPIDAMRAMAAAESCRGVASVVLMAKPHELERGLGSWHAEWFAVPLVFMTAGAAMEAIRDSLASLEVVS
jgi:3-carboxy-cis,cis-muconate cycloisomerase